MIARKDKENNYVAMLGLYFKKIIVKRGKYCYLMEKIILLQQNNHSRTYIKNMN